VLPRWIRVSQVVDYVAGVHPRFDRAKAERLLARTTVKRTSRVRELLEGHGHRSSTSPSSWRSTRGCWCSTSPRSASTSSSASSSTRPSSTTTSTATAPILVTTHQVEEIQDVITDLAFIDRGRIVLSTSMEAVRAALCRARGEAGRAAAAPGALAVHERQALGRTILLFDGADRERLASMGEVRTPGIADLFVAMMGKPAPTPGAAA
jgi:ABC-2 type transport system ATP-binding protein